MQRFLKTMIYKYKKLILTKNYYSKKKKLFKIYNYKILNLMRNLKLWKPMDQTKFLIFRKLLKMLKKIKLRKVNNNCLI